MKKDLSNIKVSNSENAADILAIDFKIDYFKRAKAKAEKYLEQIDLKIVEFEEERKNIEAKTT